MEIEGYRNVVEPLLASVAAHPDRTAVAFKGRSLTYRRFNERINREAAFLSHDMGVAAGDRVAYLLPNCIELLETYYAVQKLGAVAVPLNFKHIAREVAYLVGASGAKVLVFAAEFAEKVAAALPEMGPDVKLAAVGSLDGAAFARAVRSACGAGARVPAVADVARFAQRKPAAEPEAFRDGAALSRIQFTGGSTGVPKGAMRTHRADLVELAGVLSSNGVERTEHPVVLIQCPLEHHGGHSWFTMAFAAAATLVICDVFSAENILSMIERWRVTHMILLPPITYLRLLNCPTIDRYDVDSVVLVQSAAGGTSRKIVRAIYDRFPNAVLNYGWGQSESGLGTSLAITREMLAQDSPLLESVGTPMEGLELRIVDEDGRELPPGEMGEAQVRSEAVMEGYWGQPELTERVFAEDGWLRTGDMMVRDAAGFCTLVSRKRDIIKSGGENVFIGEVERVVNEHPNVADCVVLGTEDPVMGEAVAAVVEPVAGAALGKEELQAWCKARIASYKKPRYVLFVDSIGRDDAGKVRRDEVAKRFEAAKAAVAPRTYVRLHDDPAVYGVSVKPVGVDLAATNAYFVKGAERNLLIDTGLCQEKALESLLLAKNDLGIDMDETDILLTHHHWDHRGLAEALAGERTRIYLSEADFRCLEFQQSDRFDAQVQALAASLGEGDAELAELIDAMREARRVGGRMDLSRVTTVAPGDVLDLGGVAVEIRPAPGHTPGSVLAVLPDVGLAFFGDALLTVVSPNIAPPFDGTEADMAAAFEETLCAIEAMPVEKAFLGHGPIARPLDGNAVHERAAHLRKHGTERVQSILDAVSLLENPSGMELARNIPWNTPFSSWEEIPAMQRWIILMETIAYLDHLVAEGELARVSDEGVWRYVLPAQDHQGKE